MLQRMPQISLADSKVAVFVDGQNYYFALQQRNLRLDLEKLARALAAPYGCLTGKVLTTGVVYVDGYSSTRPFLDALRYLNWEVHEFPIKESIDTVAKTRKKEKEADMELGFRMYEMALENAYDVAVLISGDRDFVPALRRVRKIGKKVVVYQFQDFISQHLAEAADEVGLLDSLDLSQFLYTRAA